MYRNNQKKYSNSVNFENFRNIESRNLDGSPYI